MTSVHRGAVVVQAAAWTEVGAYGKAVARVQLIVAGGREVTFEIYESSAFSDTIIVEIDGDFLDDRPSVRINMNDMLIHDSTRDDQPVESPRRPDLDPPEMGEIAQAASHGPGTRLRPETRGVGDTR